MKLSTKGDYATRAVLYLAQCYGQGVVQIHEIARQQKIPIKYLEQILLTLKNVGILRSKKGVKGGYYLARSPEEITLGEVVRAMDGPLAPIKCASTNFYERCPEELNCGMRNVWLEVRNAIANILDNTTFSDLCEDMDKRQKVLVYQI